MHPECGFLVRVNLIIGSILWCFFLVQNLRGVPTYPSYGWELVTLELSSMNGQSRLDSICSVSHWGFLPANSGQRFSDGRLYRWHQVPS